MSQQLPESVKQQPAPRPPVKAPHDELPLKYVLIVALIGIVFALIFMSFFYFSTH